MGRKPKTPKFERFNRAVNCFGERARPISEIFSYLDGSKKTILEIGCGRAELLMEYAKENSDINYIGIDIKSDRMFRPAESALELKLSNVAFIQSDVNAIDEIFSEDSIDQIWVTFPDPQPRARGEKHRLINKKFMTKYMAILSDAGVFHFKTDDNPLFEYALEVLQDIKVSPDQVVHDVHKEGLTFPLTTYEKHWIELGKNISYLRIDL